MSDSQLKSLAAKLAAALGFAPEGDDLWRSPRDEKAHVWALTEVFNPSVKVHLDDYHSIQFWFERIGRQNELIAGMEGGHSWNRHRGAVLAIDAALDGKLVEALELGHPVISIVEEAKARLTPTPTPS